LFDATDRGNVVILVSGLGIVIEHGLVRVFRKINHFVVELDIFRLFNRQGLTHKFDVVLDVLSGAHKIQTLRIHGHDAGLALGLAFLAFVVRVKVCAFEIVEIKDEPVFPVKKRRATVVDGVFVDFLFLLEHV